MDDTETRRQAADQDAAPEVHIPLQYGPEVSLEERLRRARELTVRS